MSIANESANINAEARRQSRVAPRRDRAREAESYMPSYSTSLGILMVSVEDVLRMTITRSFDGDDFTLAFVRQLELGRHGLVPQPA